MSSWLFVLYLFDFFIVTDTNIIAALHYSPFPKLDWSMFFLTWAMFYGAGILKLWRRLDWILEIDDINDTHWKKLCFNQFITRTYWRRSLAASGLFHVLTQSIKFFRYFLAIESSLKVMKNAFYFSLKALFALLVRFWLCIKMTWLER